MPPRPDAMPRGVGAGVGAAVGARLALHVGVKGLYSPVSASRLTHLTLNATPAGQLDGLAWEAGNEPPTVNVLPPHLTWRLLAPGQHCERVSVRGTTPTVAYEQSSPRAVAQGSPSADACTASATTTTTRDRFIG